MYIYCIFDRMGGGEFNGMEWNNCSLGINIVYEPTPPHLLGY